MTPDTAINPEPDAPITAPSSGFADFILNQIRRARVRARITINHLDSVGVALKAGWIGGEDALEMLDEAGLLPLIEASS
jgi:hypothetical protein